MWRACSREVGWEPRWSPWPSWRSRTARPSMDSGRARGFIGSSSRFGAQACPRCRSVGRAWSTARSPAPWTCFKRIALKIERLRIDAFGQFHSFDRELGAGLNVFYGPNEAGKSTLLAFIRAVLFGFPKRGEPVRYEPDRGTIGGELLLKTAAVGFWVRRSGSRRSEGGLLLRSLERERLPPSRLNESLCALSRELFCQVFAFALHELSSFEELAS